MTTYKVVDTNIFLLDAHNLLTLGADGSVIVLPETVLDEIDSKKSGLTELAYQAREFGRLLSKAVKKQSFQFEDIFVNELDYEGVTIQVASSSMYTNFANEPSNIINDRKIIEIGLQYHNNFVNDSTLFISNDVMCRLRADSIGLKTSDLKEVEHIDFEFTKDLEVPYDLFTNLHDTPIELVDKDYKFEHYNYRFTTPQSAQVKLAYIGANGLVKVIGKETEKEIRDASRQPAPPINNEQLMLSRAILDQTIDLVVCEALAGSGFN